MYNLANFRDKELNLQKKVVQRSTDPIDALWFHPRTVNGVRIPQSHEVATPIESPFGSESTTGSSSSDSTPSSSVATSTGDVHVPASFEPPANSDEPNRWCVPLRSRPHSANQHSRVRLSHGHRSEWGISEECRIEGFSFALVSPSSYYRQVSTLSLGIKKATLTFATKFFWLLVQNYASPTQVDNLLTWDHAIMVATFVVGLEVDFARMLIAQIHERNFKANTTLPIPCLNFHLCRDAGVPIWHYEQLLQATKTLDIDLIQDNANVDAPRKEPLVEVPPLGANLVEDVKEMQGDDLSLPAAIDDSPASPYLASSQAPSSSVAT
uniref:Integrase core domain containing protein n=1 Tax=Solanum tuberosum TaxID=4113 RepID=M1DCJ7_SOLTU